MIREFHILNLGAGVQSTAVALLFTFDVAIFADTQEEPEAVYSHLAWLKSAVGYPVWSRTCGKLGDALLGIGVTRFASIPAFTDTGVARRQCSREYKADVIERAIKREVLGLKPHQRISKDTRIHQYFGISRDEARRAVSIRERVEERPGWQAHFPLLEKGWTRANCLRFLSNRVPHIVPRSACVFCPYHNDSEWRRLKRDPVAWARIVQIDHALRTPGMLVNRGLREQLWLHNSHKPIDTIDFTAQSEFPNFVRECEGMCGV